MSWSVIDARAEPRGYTSSRTWVYASAWKGRSQKFA